jgi:hypothetical protein
VKEGEAKERGSRSSERENEAREGRASQPINASRSEGSAQRLPRVLPRT